MKSPVCVLLVLSCVLSPGQDVVAQEENSTRKIRIQPGAFSARCGSAVDWRPSVEAALTESASTGKPVFWYIPTVDGSFMDRKPVIDRYMLAGPFSWPSIIRQINEHFIPVRSAVGGSLQEKYDLKRYRFVEPGFVVLDRDAKKTLQVDQITTMNPQWLASLVAGAAGVHPAALSDCPELADAWKALRSGDYDYDLSEITVAPRHAAERILLSGMLAFRRGDHQQAAKIWSTAREAQPDHPLAWKAVAEAENWGPYVRGFEVHRELPEAALTAGVRSRGSAAPRRLYTEKQLWKRSAEFLLGMQSADGGWVDSDYDFGGTDSLPNVHVAVTALCGNALLDALERLPDHRERLLEAIHRAADYCSNKSNINYVDRDEILWAQAYRTRFLSRLVSLDPESDRKYRPVLEKAVTDLESIRTRRGSWYHEYANPFVTATALLALKHAERAGAAVDMSRVGSGIRSLSNDRFDNGAFPYYEAREVRQRDSNSPDNGNIPASAGRMPVCELALWSWDGSSDERLQAALVAAFENHHHLNAGYKYDNHTSTMAYGGFFFWYDMRSRAEALSFLNDKTQREEFAAVHRDLVLDLPELDGCFVDSHELGRCYGTAMALQTLALLDAIQR